MQQQPEHSQSYWQSLSSAQRMRIVGVLAVLVIAAIVVARPGGGSGDTPEPRENTNLTGRFVRWEPVDDARGYAYFTITNRGSSSATATCSIRVSNDFGNFGFDSLVGETVPAGKTISGKIAISVDEGSFLIDQGEVTDC